MTAPRENFCRICLQAAANSTLNSNFGSDPNPSTQLCPPHLEQWHASAEFKARMAHPPGSGLHFLPDFVMRTIKEEAVIKERLKREEAEKAAAAKPPEAKA